MAPLPAFAGDNVKVPMTYGEANYFCRRKITMVSGCRGSRRITLLIIHMILGVVYRGFPVHAPTPHRPRFFLPSSRALDRGTDIRSSHPYLDATLMTSTPVTVPYLFTLSVQRPV